MGAEFGKNRSGFGNSACAVGLQFVPVRRQAEDWARVTGAQRADDEVGHVGRVLDHDQQRVIVEADSKLLAGGAAVRQKAAP